MEKSDNLTQLLKEFRFNVDLTDYRDLRCEICESILLNPYRCDCGSRYCKKCIENYLNGERRICPNTKNACQIQISSIESDLKMDLEIIDKISVIKLKCPEPYCYAYIKIECIKEHMKVHQIQCPYHSLGCTKPRVRQASIANHLHNKIYEHTTLLLDSIYHLHNEITSIKDEINFNKEKNGINESIFERINFELSHLKSNDVMLLEEIEKLKQIDNKYQQKMVKIHKRIEINKNQVFEKKHEIKNENVESIKHGKDCIHLSMKERKTLENSSTESAQYLDYNDLSFKNIRKQYFAPFEWNINFSEMHDNQENAKNIQNFRKLFSIPFYSHKNGYKICLRLDRGGLCSGFSIHFHLMKGEFDEELQWPMPFEILIGFSDPKTGTWRLIKKFIYKNIEEENKSKFFKPISKMNSSCGTNYIQIKGHFEMIFIKCAITVVGENV